MTPQLSAPERTLNPAVSPGKPLLRTSAQEGPLGRQASIPMALLVRFQMAVQTGYTAMHMAVGDLFHHNIAPGTLS